MRSFLYSWGGGLEGVGLIGCLLYTSLGCLPLNWDDVRSNRAYGVLTSCVAPPDSNLSVRASTPHAFVESAPGVPHRVAHIDGQHRQAHHPREGLRAFLFPQRPEAPNGPDRIQRPDAAAAPLFAVRDMLGDPLQLTDLHGKYALLEFYPPRDDRWYL